jgi:hypothetical protein
VRERAKGRHTIPSKKRNKIFDFSKNLKNTIFSKNKKSIQRDFMTVGRNLK